MVSIYTNHKKSKQTPNKVSNLYESYESYKY